MKAISDICRLAVTAAAMAAFAAGFSSGGAAADTVVWTRWETSLRSSRLTSNPYIESPVQVTYRGPDGRTYRGSGFWDGGATFKLRFMFPSPGQWTWQTECSDPSDTGLHGQTGTVHVQPYSGDNPLYQHGALRASRNRRYLEHADSAPFLWIGDTAWLAYLRATDNEWRAFVAGRRRRGISVIVVSCTCTNGKRERSDVRGRRPFRDAAASRWNPAFWQAFDQKIQAANEHGLVVVVTGVAWGRDMRQAKDEHVLAFARNLAARLAGNHVCYSPRQDWDAGREDLLDAAGMEIKRAAAFALVTQHPRRIVGQGATEPMPDQVLHHYYHVASTDFVSVQTGMGPVPDNARLDVAVTTRATCQWIRALYEEQPHKPVIDLEGVYGGNYHHRHEDERLMMVRRAGYYSFLSGAAGYTSSAFAVWAWGRPIHFGPIKDVPPISKAMQHPYVDELSRLGRFFRSIPWWRLQPRPELVINPPKGWTRKIASAASAVGDLAVVYVPEGRSMRLDLSKLAESLNGRWYIPSADRWHTVDAPIAARGVQTFPLPPGANEAVLVLEAPVSDATTR